MQCLNPLIYLGAKQRKFNWKPDAKVTQGRRDKADGFLAALKQLLVTLLVMAHGSTPHLKVYEKGFSIY